MIALGIDTSTPAGSVALVRERRLLGEINLATGGHHQARLLRSIDALLDLAGLDISDVGVLSVALGPGTFTGLRVGIATAKGLAVARMIPAFGFSSLAAMGHRFLDQGLPVAALIDAGRGEVYAALFRGEEGKLNEALPERSGSPGDFLAALPPEPVLWCGDGVESLRNDILRVRPGRDRLEDGPCFLGATLAGLASERLEEGHTWSIASLKPNYIRPPDAEIGRRR